MADDLTEWLREVDDEAADYADGKISNEQLTFGWRETWLLYFARAIARECARICHERGLEGDRDGQLFVPAESRKCRDAILQRFGIEKGAK